MREKVRLKEERDRQAMEDVNRHFELSIEFAKKVRKIIKLVQLDSY